MLADDFLTLLQARLLQGTRFRVYHVSTPPASCPPLFLPGPGRSEEATTLESHFLCLSQHRPVEDGRDDSPEVLVLGIEVLIFAAASLTTIFVSKADSTGLLDGPVSVKSHRISLAQTAITAFLDCLLKSGLDRGRLVLSLFARSQNQYLFPGSIENVTKHVLDDRQLIKWWCRILDPLVRQRSADAPQSVGAHLVVPGCDSSETRAFFPASAQSGTGRASTWFNAYPVDLLVEDTSLPPACLVPRLPDDPKSRFLEDLDAQRDADGNWRGIKTLDQFWEMMSYRQECSAGRLVGFVWVVFTSVTACKKTDQSASSEISSRQDQPAEEARLKVNTVSTAPSMTAAVGTRSINGTTSTKESIEPVDTGLTAHTPPIIVTERSCVAPKISELTATLTGSTKLDKPHNDEEQDLQMPTTGDMAPSEAQRPSPLVLSSENYQVLMDELLRLDFAGEQMAVKSTKIWRETAMKLANTSLFGIHVDGMSIMPETVSSTSIAADTTVQQSVNVLTAVRRKRKTAPGEGSVDHGSKEGPVVNTLATNLVRKKPKA